MTDQTIPDVTDDELELAREWAEFIESDKGAWAAQIRAAARVILHAIPTPPRPTLADMTDEERAACLRMQCDTGPNRSVRGFIAEVHPGGCRVIERDTWEWRSCSDDLVTPRPDLPRMEWPGDQKPAPAPALPEGWRLAEHPDLGRVIVTNPTPNSDGRVYYVHPSADPLGFDWLFCDPDELTYLDGPTTKEAGTTTGPDHLAVGTVIESADDPRLDALPDGGILLDRDDDSVTKRDGGWTGEGYIPFPFDCATFGPWTVLHIPKEEA